MKTFSLESSALSTAYSPNGNNLVVGFYNGTVLVLDSTNGSSIMNLGTHNGSVSSVFYTNDGSKIISASIDGIIKIWDGKDGRELFTFDNEVQKSIRYKIASTIDGRYIVSGSGLTVRVWDIANRQLLREFKEVKNTQCIICSVAISPDGRYTVAGQDWSKMSCWDIQTGQIVFEKDFREGFHHGQDLCSVDYNPVGNCIAAGFWDGSIILLDAKNGQEIRRLVGHRTGEGTKCAMVYAKYSPNGQNIVSGSWDHKIKIWDVANGKALKTIVPKLIYFKVENDGLKRSLPISEFPLEDVEEEADNYFRRYISVSYSPNEQDVVSVDDKGTIKIWNVDNGEEIVRFVPKEMFLYYIWDNEVWIDSGGMISNSWR
jgi:WD40 repeat protein